QLHRADQQRLQQVPVGERLLVQRLPTAPPPDQMHEPVDLAEPLDQRLAPSRHRVLVGEVDRAPVPPLRIEPELLAECIDLRLPPSARGDPRPARPQPRRPRRPQPPAAPRDRDDPPLKTPSLVHLRILPHPGWVQHAEQRKTTRSDAGLTTEDPTPPSPEA